MSQIELTFLLPPLNFLIFLFSYFGKLPTHFLKSETAFNLHIYLMIESSQFFSLIFLKSITLLLLLFHDHYQTLGLLCGFLQDVPHCVCQKSLEPHSNKYCCHLKKKMHNVRVQGKLYLRHSEDCSLGDSTSDSLEKLHQEDSGGRSIYMTFGEEGVQCNQALILQKIFC